jgi:ABC-2 type transport system permease protein
VIARHLWTFLWLRWRLFVNQLRKGGVVSAAARGILFALILLAAAGMFVGCFLIGLLLPPDLSPAVLLLVWDGLVVAFLLFWTGGLLTELQRSEVLAMDKFLHLPVSLLGAFLINYVSSSLLSVSLALFGPAMLGLALGLTLRRGPAMLLVLPLLAAFLLMVTALTYQFQSWLASLMTNKRRRRSIIAVVTVAFIVLAQSPQLLQFLGHRAKSQVQESIQWRKEQEAELQRALQGGQVTPAEYQRRRAEIFREQGAREKAENEALWENVKRTAQVVNTALPPGWLPLGAMGAAEGALLIPVLGTLGLGLLGAGSLWRSYRTNLRLYTGYYTGGKARAAPAAPPAAKPAVQPGQAAAHLLEREVPGASEQAAAVALAGFRSLLRAPEAKMQLLTPVILVLVFGGILFAQRLDPPAEVRPLMAYGAMASVLFCVVQLVGNQFGFDRGGFRVFVLSPAPRREILLGKNLAFAPLVLVLGVAAVTLLEVVYPMPPATFLACLPQFVSMYLVFCVLANCLSILAPLRIQPGTMKPVNYKAGPFLFHLAFLFLCPLALAPTLLPLGVESLLEALGWGTAGVAYLGLSLAECVAVVYLYRAALTWQGALLQAREQKILETVTTREE